MILKGDDYKMIESDTNLITCPVCGRKLRPVKNAPGTWCPCGNIIDLSELSEKKLYDFFTNEEKERIHFARERMTEVQARMYADRYQLRFEEVSK